MADDFGERIAARAIGNVGSPFRLHGRSFESGFDCVGLLADALRSVGFTGPIPVDYGLHGQFEPRACAFFDTVEFETVEIAGPTSPGDFALAAITPRQLHFIIYADGGFVHAHAGLRRVVLTPWLSPWLLLSRWRYLGK